MIYLLLTALLFFSGCVNLSGSKKNKNINHVQKKYKKTFNIKITNLHCKLCAYNLVKFIAKIDGVLNVKFNYIAKNYQQSYFIVEIDSRKTTKDQITIPLIKSGFFVQSDQNTIKK
jgi:copper chaperone CopZ